MKDIKATLELMKAHQAGLLEPRMSRHEAFVRSGHAVLLGIVLVGVWVLTLLFRLNTQELSRRLEAEAAANREARQDPLTGLPNRRSLLERLENAIPSAKRHKHSLALLYLDLDGFKQVNDTFGHAAGDTLLRETAERLKRGTRAEDIVARLGGDEFLIALPFVETCADVAVVSDKIVNLVSQPYVVQGTDARVSASIGVAMYPHDGETLDELVTAADAALYSAKSSGKGVYHFPSENADPPVSFMYAPPGAPPTLAAA
jgi:diguanylate cyclase (GGDEF)-like protein